MSEVRTRPGYAGQEQEMEIKDCQVPTDEFERHLFEREITQLLGSRADLSLGRPRYLGGGQFRIIAKPAFYPEGMETSWLEMPSTEITAWLEDHDGRPLLAAQLEGNSCGPAFSNGASILTSAAIKIISKLPPADRATWAAGLIEPVSKEVSA